MNSKLISLYATLLAIIILIVYYDTRPYYKALNVISKTDFKNHVISQKKLVDNDLELYFECNNIKINNTFSTKKDTILYRNCLNKNITKIKTTPGALIFSASASSILINNPRDYELKKNALFAIDLARVHLITNKPLEYDPLDNVNKAHDKSLLLSLFNGKKHIKSFFDMNVETLNRAETYIVSPHTIIKQNTFSKGVVKAE